MYELVREKSTIWVPSRSDTNRPVQSQKQVRSLKFCIELEEGLYYPCSENKSVIGFAVTAKLICAFVFAQACRWFSQAAAHIILRATFNGPYAAI